MECTVQNISDACRNTKDSTCDSAKASTCAKAIPASKKCTLNSMDASPKEFAKYKMTNKINCNPVNKLNQEGDWSNKTNCDQCADNCAMTTKNHSTKKSRCYRIDRSIKNAIDKGNRLSKEKDNSRQKCSNRCINAHMNNLRKNDTAQCSKKSTDHSVESAANKSAESTNNRQCSERTKECFSKIRAMSKISDHCTRVKDSENR